MSTNNWVIKHLEFAQKANDKDEMVLRIQSVIDRLNVSHLIDIKKPKIPDNIIRLEGEQPPKLRSY
jgi:hypothetical protein